MIHVTPWRHVDDKLLVEGELLFPAGQLVQRGKLFQGTLSGEYTLARLTEHVDDNRYLERASSVLHKG